MTCLGEYLYNISDNGKRPLFIGGGVTSPLATIHYIDKQKRDGKRRSYKLKKMIEKLKNQL